MSLASRESHLSWGSFAWLFVPNATGPGPVSLLAVCYLPPLFAARTMQSPGDITLTAGSGGSDPISGMGKVSLSVCGGGRATLTQKLRGYIILFSMFAAGYSSRPDIS